MVDCVAFVFHRDLGNLFFFDSVLVHVSPHLQRKYPEQSGPGWWFENMVEDAPESILRVGVYRRHFLLSNAETRVVHSRGDVPPAANWRKDSCSTPDVD